MEKIIQISINSILFKIDDDAYTLLSSYLNEIHDAFKNDTSGEEIEKDIEARIAEHLKEMDEEVITLEMIEKVIAKMGTVSELTEGSSSESTRNEPNDSKDKLKQRLFRDEDEAILGGVCSGIAAYLDIDQTWVRIIFVLLMFFGFGIIIPIYIILWLIVPPAKTASERIEMRGGEVTLSSIASAVKNRVSELRKKHECSDKHDSDKTCSKKCCEGKVELRTRANAIALKLGQILKVSIRIILGSIIALCGIGIIIGFITGATALFSLQIPSEYESLLSMINADPYIIALVISSITLILIPSMLILFGGLTMVSGIKAKRTTYGLLTVAIWMGALTVLIVSATHIGVRILERTSRENNVPIKRIIINNNQIEISRTDSLLSPTSSELLK